MAEWPHKPRQLTPSERQRFTGGRFLEESEKDKPEEPLFVFQCDRCHDRGWVVEKWTEYGPVGSDWQRTRKYCAPCPECWKETEAIADAG